MKVIIRLKGGAGSGNFNHAGIPGHVGGSKPTWSGDKSEEYEGYTVRNGRFGLTKDRWAVDRGEGEFGPWEDTPAKAVEENTKLIENAAENAKYQEKYESAKAEVLSGNPMSRQAMSVLSNGGKYVSTSRATAILRGLGISAKDTSAIVSRLGVFGETSFGTQLHSPEELVTRARNYLKIG